MAPSKIEMYAAIRRDSRMLGLSVRALARKYGVHRRTVREALSSAFPAPRKKLPPRRSRLDAFKPAIDEMLRADLDAPRKQRHTVKRMFERLRDEHEMEGISYSTVCDYVQWRRPEIRHEAGLGPGQVFIPQSHRPGAEAEVDFGDVWVKLRGQPTKCTLFTFRMSFSGKAVHRIFASEGQEAFLEGHVHALRVLGGVPTGKVRYDNLRSAVSRVLGFRERRESERWVAFRSHYGLEAFYCQPGKEGAHEKGGVEGEVGRFRRNHLVPVPEVDSLAELNARVERWDVEDDDRRIGSRPHTVGEHFAVEQPLLRALPEEHFETARLFSPRVDRYGQIGIRMNRYSVPVRLIGQQVRVLLHASELVIYEGRTEVAWHERLATRGGVRLELDHYLEALLRKPGALPGATALEQARAAGKFTPVHDAWWAAVRKIHGDPAGTRALIEVLLLHRTMTHEHVVAGIAAALQAGAMTSDAVAVEARKAARTDTVSTVDHRPEESFPRVTSLTERRLAALPPDTRPLPSVAAYDSLLRRHRPPPAEP
ncbi:IS21 family transposase [Streptomyces sp. NPDC127108]|uniref:IS21 family transposase n=1 Tax=Streptomyces sp. NPDC127108 TaxID=3345361 RepID=UPI003631A29E